MTPEKFVGELEQIFDKRLKPEQTPLYVEKVRRFSPEQRVEILNRVLEEAKYFPKVSEIFKAAETLGYLAPDFAKAARPHRWTETPCGLCHGEGRLAIFWKVRIDERETGRVELHILRQVVQYSKGFDYIMPADEYRTIFRCKCMAGDVETIPKSWPKFTREVSDVREVWL